MKNNEKAIIAGAGAALAYFVLGLCFAKDLFACALFLIAVICIIIIKYLKMSENEEQ